MVDGRSMEAKTKMPDGRSYQQHLTEALKNFEDAAFALDRLVPGGIKVQLSKKSDRPQDTQRFVQKLGLVIRLEKHRQAASDNLQVTA
ncbi:MAG: hypothetical protein EKK48_12345 [Candidatus Melainabacteria bacterium]|nr:MAG: hypothetical protein EKK48_12345 [Candidatus Melainabacteria bacterium]